MPMQVGIDKLIELVERHFGLLIAKLLLALIALGLAALAAYAFVSYAAAPVINWVPGHVHIGKIPPNVIQHYASIFADVLTAAIALSIAFWVPYALWQLRYQRTVNGIQAMLAQKDQSLDERIQTIAKTVVGQHNMFGRQIGINDTLIQILVPIADAVGRSTNIIANLDERLTRIEKKITGLKDLKNRPEALEQKSTSSASSLASSLDEPSSASSVSENQDQIGEGV